MNRQFIAGGMYGDHLPSGAWCVLIPKRHVLTHLGRVEFPKGEAFGPLYLRCTDHLGFRFAGQAHDTLDPACWEWEVGRDWFPYHPPCVGVSPVIYDLFGTLHRSPGGSVGSQGYRYVTPDNQIVTGDASYGNFHGLFEYTQIASDLWIGQAAYDGGGVQVLQRSEGISRWPTGEPEEVWTLRQLGFLVETPDGDEWQPETGNRRFVRANTAGARVAGAFTRPEGVVLFDGTLAELRALPPVGTVVDPTPPVIFTPPQPKEEPLMNLPDPGAVKAALKRERDKFPSATVTEAQMGQILNNTALQFPHMGMHRKDGQAPQPGTGIGISHDVLRVMPPGDPLGYWSDVLGATGVGQAIPLAPTWERSSDGAESFVVPVAVGTSQPPAPPLPPAPPAPQPPAPPAPPVGKPLPDYGQFVTVESTEVANAYEQRTGHGPAISDQYHTAYRRLVERWTHRDVINDILGRALQDGGPGGDLR